jgi:hypothetical protein
VDRAFAAFKELADERKTVTDDDITRIVGAVTAVAASEREGN